MLAWNIHIRNMPLWNNDVNTILMLVLMMNRFKIDLTTIGSRIKKLRGAMLQEELAAYLDVSQGHLSKIERGKIAPSLEILVLLASRFHKSVDWIIRGETG